jgi:hypothetical protein
VGFQPNDPGDRRKMVREFKSRRPHQKTFTDYSSLITSKLFFRVPGINRTEISARTHGQLKLFPASLAILAAESACWAFQDALVSSKETVGK